MTVEKRKGRSWYYRFGHGGETHCRGGFSTAAEAERAEAEHKALLDDPNTLTRMAERRLEHIRAYCSDQHFQDSKIMLRHFCEEWGHLPVSCITKRMVREWALSKVGKLTNNNINRHLRALKSLMQFCLDDDIIKENPVRGVKFFPHSKKPRTVTSVGEIEEALIKLPAEERAFVTVAWLTAARVGEVVQLAWEDINWDDKTLWLTTHKSKDGSPVRREIPMVPQVEQALRFMWRRRYAGSPWVFTNPQMANKTADKTKWRYLRRPKLLKKASFNFHDLRHSTATMLARLGVELTVIQKILGHQRPTTTDIYLQALPVGVVDAFVKLGRITDEGAGGNR